MERYPSLSDVQVLLGGGDCKQDDDVCKTIMFEYNIYQEYNNCITMIVNIIIGMMIIEGNISHTLKYMRVINSIIYYYTKYIIKYTFIPIGIIDVNCIKNIVYLHI